MEKNNILIESCKIFLRSTAIRVPPFRSEHRFKFFIGDLYYAMEVLAICGLPILFDANLLPAAIFKFSGKTLDKQNTIRNLCDLTKTTSDDKEIEKLTKPSFYSNKGRAGQL